MNGTAAILQAVRDGDMPLIERLLTADPLLVRAGDEHRKTPLHWAAEQDRRDIAQMLLDSGADLEATTSWGATALDWRPPWVARKLRICCSRAVRKE